MNPLGLFKPLLASPLYIRVSLALWGVPVAAFTLVVLSQLEPRGVADWALMAGFGVVFLMGASLCWLAFSKPGRLEDARKLLAPSFEPVEIAFVLGVILLAVPITMLLRAAGVADE